MVSTADELGKATEAQSTLPRCLAPARRAGRCRSRSYPPGAVAPDSPHHIRTRGDRQDRTGATAHYQAGRPAKPHSCYTGSYGRRPSDSRNAPSAGTTAAARATATRSNSFRNSPAAMPFRYPGQQYCNSRSAMAVVAGCNRSRPETCFNSRASNAGSAQIA